MKSLISKKCIVAMAAVAIGSPAIYAAPNNNDPYAGQYEVLTIPEHSSRMWREGELIVKLRAEEASDPVKLKRVKGKVTANSSASDLNSLLDKYGVEEAEPLMPLTGALVTPKAKRAKAYNGQEMTDSDLSSLYVIRFDNTKVSNLKEVASEFSKLPEVEYAEPNYIVYACAAGASDYTSDPMYSQQWGIPAINLDKLWNAPIINSKRPVIAILDTGVDIEHPDLADNIWTNDFEVNGSDDRDDDGNGFIDDIHGWDFVNQTARMRDNNGHGTHCAGIAAAVSGNGIGITGANPDAFIMPIAVLQSDGTGDVGTIIKGIDYAVANGADVLSMSFGGASHSLAEYDALAKAYQKAVLVAAAGNNGGDLNMCHLPSYPPVFPGAYNFVLGVMASDNNGNRAGFSNWDCDGPFAIGPYNIEEQYGYDIMAPGTNILSTYPGGAYKSLNGTSMACPLVAGAISRLYQCKDIPTKELLFGDLINSQKGGIVGSLDIEAAYKITDADRVPTLALVTYRLDDALGDNDLRVDAGETIDLYPTVRNFWGQARNVRFKLSLGENEDPEIVEFITPEVSFDSELSSYSLNESKNPLRFKISDKCVDGRHIKFRLTGTCDNNTEDFVHNFILIAENGIELCGVLKEDMTLYPDKHYIVPSSLGVPEGRTLTILPGVTLKFKDGAGITVDGNLEAHGEPDNMITFTKGDLDQGNIPRFLFNENSNFSFVKFEMLNTYLPPQSYAGIVGGVFQNCIFKYLNLKGVLAERSNFKKCLFDGISTSFYGDMGLNYNVEDCIVTRRYYYSTENLIDQLNLIHNSVLFNNTYNSSVNFSGSLFDTYTFVFTDPRPNYFGSSLESKVRPTILDILNIESESSAQYDLSNMLKRPPYEAPGCLWKVVVDGYDAQDEFEMLPDLGVGKHKFEVYFSKEMNREKNPSVAMGVRPPYTQIAIAEEGSWRTEEIDGDKLDVYTVYLTIKGSDAYDGLNRIYVADAEDLEHFPCPIEDFRFNVNVQSAGAMSSGFMAEAGVGQVKLTWENPEENFDDMLGYNLYRYTLNDNEAVGDTIRINEKLLNTEEFIDYDIVPGTTYCYYYKVLRTSLEENSPSKIVAATPRAAGKGDANASGDVDVADVVTEVNYMVGKDPKPFMFEAADINSDNDIDILDVVGTVNIIMHPEAASAMAFAENSAVYTIENGVLYVESSVELYGVQVDLSCNAYSTTIKTLEALRGMETTGDWLNENDYRFIAFSLSGKTLESGKQPILEIGDAEIDNIILVDAAGNKVLAVRGGENTGISSIMAQQINLPYPNPFSDVLNVPVIIASEGTHDVEITLSNLAGVTPIAKDCVLGYGEHVVSLNTSNLPEGFYIVTLVVDGKKIQSVKAIKK